MAFLANIMSVVGELESRIFLYDLQAMNNMRPIKSSGRVHHFSDQVVILSSEHKKDDHCSSVHHKVCCE